MDYHERDCCPKCKSYDKRQVGRTPKGVRYECRRCRNQWISLCKGYGDYDDYDD